MAFHIEVRTPLRHARSFNLTEEELRRTVVDPWLNNRPIELGDRAWKPDEAELKILEGPELSNPEMSFGQGWSNAERRGEWVTRQIIGDAAEARRSASAGPTGLVIETDSALQTVAGLVSGQQETQSVDIETLKKRIDSGDPSIAAVIVVVQRS
jgi:hypothetical protein